MLEWVRQWYNTFVENKQICCNLSLIEFFQIYFRAQFENLDHNLVF